MRMAGIVAEYDPFHKGHAWQLKEASRLTGADAVVVYPFAVDQQTVHVKQRSLNHVTSQKQVRNVQLTMYNVQ